MSTKFLGAAAASIAGSLVLMAMTIALPAAAATPIDQTKPLAADGTVSIDNLKGRIVVRTWAQPQVKIAGMLGNGVEKLIVEGDSRNLRIEVKYPNSKGSWNAWGSGNNSEPSVIEVTMPQRASLDIDAVSADVDVQQMAGRSLSIDNVSGKVEVTSSSPGEATVDNVSGDILLRITSAKVHVESVSGDIHLQGGLTGDVHMESVSGKTTLIAPALHRLDLSTVSGDADLTAGVIASGTIKVDSVSGEIGLTLPATTSAQLHVESFSGDITSPVGKVVTEEYGPGKSLDAKFGTGQGKINLESFSGNVRIRSN
ncbi:MAG TPA: DUF4097 family beta strand repeat-containing protein [Arenimonas sp.]|uniref:DUF4097 family beta strand repeat-containing protein n=1 Tax=Arenimonas sp. TaxID=1872635 RepID=UPI002BBAAFC7|nr:DUF4097 family beta strand repeat-containing protein [Arenimonas sp.]HMB57600.1 DUF4097 family beta strand repeat-containing protein [Arenimonas sp.]